MEAKTVRATLYDPDRPASQRHLTGTIFLSPGGRQEIHFPGSLEQSKKKRPIPGPAARPSPPPPETWDLINTPLSFALTVAPDALYLESDATAGAFDITNWYYSARLQPSKDVPLPAKKP